MSRLIDAEALMKNIDEQLASHDGLDMFDKETVYLIGVNDVASYIVTAPTIDAVEVVRCGKCKYKDDPIMFCLDLGKDGYCSRGERKTE